MNCKVWCGFPGESLDNIKLRVPRARKSLDEGLLAAKEVYDAGQMVVFEIEMEDGSRYDKDETKRLISLRREQLKAISPISY